MNLFDKFIQIFSQLEKHEVEYVLIGGFAVILYGLPRLTNDIDLFIKPDEENINKLKNALKSAIDDNCIDEISLKMLSDYQVVRYGSPEGLYIDLIINLGEAYSYNDIDYTIKDIHGSPVRIATAETLYKMKKDTVRPIDRSDAVFLADLLSKKKENL